MKKFIALALSVMMIMSLVVIPVSADEAAAAVTYPDPTVWVTAENVEDYMAEEYGAYYCQSNWTKDENGGYFIVGGTKYDRFKFYNGTYSSGNNGFGVFDKMAPKKPVYLTMIGGTVYNADKDGAASLDPWDGFKIKADVASSVGGAYTSTGTIAFSNQNKTQYGDKDIRVDSIRFMMDEYDADSWVSLLGLNDNWRSNDPAYNGANRVTAIRIINGGVQYSDMAQGGYVSLLPAETLKADTWYRIEKIVDLRNDNGTTQEVWQRSIIYVDATNEILGETGWVKAQERTIPTSYSPVHPFNTAASGTGKFPEGAHVYFDDFKSWAIESPETTFIAGTDANYEKYLTYPIANDGITKASKGTDKQTSYRNSWGLGFSTHNSYWYASSANNYDSDGDGEKDQRGMNPEMIARKTGFQAAVMDSDYIIMQEDFMVDGAYSTELGLLDLHTNINYNTCTWDPAAPYFPAAGRTYNAMNGVIRILNGVLTVKEWDTETEMFKSDGTTSAGTGWYINDVKSANGEDFAITLTPGEWYTATLKIDQSAYAGNMYTVASDASGRDPYYDANGEKNGAKMTKTQMTKAVVTITDSQGNTYTTEEFDYKSPLDYIQYSIYNAVLLADIRRPGLSTGAVGGTKVNLDNMSVVLTDSTADAEDAFVVYEESFDARTTGSTYDKFIMDQFNAQSLVEAEGSPSYPLEYAQIVKDTSKNMVGIPTIATIAFPTSIVSDTATLANSVRLYQGSTDVSDLITDMTYDEAANKLNITFSALAPVTEYTVKVGRDVTEPAGNIFSYLYGTTEVATDTFITGYGDSGELIFEPLFEVWGDTDIESDDCAGLFFPEDFIMGDNSTLTSLNASPVNFVAIAAVYDEDGRMEDMMSQTGVIYAGETLNIFTDEAHVLYPSVVDGDNGELKTVKAFIWNAWSLMKPIANQYAYPAVD